MKRLLIFIVTYNAERTIRSVLSRIPVALMEDNRYRPEILLIDDCSADRTFERGAEARFDRCPITVLKNPRNLGYGGNQKLGYRYAIDCGFDFVALLHGDGQYAPEELPRLLEPLLGGEAEAVFGSRMLEPGAALRGQMPLYKYVGNKALTWCQNRLVGTTLSEYHSGFRIYSVDALRRIPFELNSNYFDFDTEIIVQLHAAGLRIRELPIPTFYGDEICYVNGVQYSLRILAACLRYRIQQFGVLYEPKFDLGTKNEQYTAKFDFLSSHSLPLERIEPADHLLILGCGPPTLVHPFSERAHKTSAVDIFIDESLRKICVDAVATDLDSFSVEQHLSAERRFSKILALDILEHLRSPERLLAQLRTAPQCEGALLILTTPNVAFCIVRLMLLFGLFNYGKRGILDRTHTRLFTFRSLRKILTESGFDIHRTRGIPAPFPLAFGRNWLGRLLLRLNDLLIRAAPGLFAYQIYVEATPRPTAASLLRRASENAEREREKLDR